MNKKEWKLQHAANRRLFHGLFRHMAHNGEKSPTDSESFNIAARVFWSAVGNMHPSFKCAMQRNINVAYPIQEDRWAIRHNTTCFNENRRDN